MNIRVLGNDDLIRRLSPDRAAAGVYRGMRKAMLRVEREAKRNLSGTVLKVGTGHLRAATHTYIEIEGLKVIGVLANSAIYAKAQEEGAVITPKRARALAIPLRKNLPSSPTAIADAFVFRSKSGEVFIARALEGRRFTRIELLYVLKRSVRIPARMPFGKAVRAKLFEVKGDIRGELLKEFLKQ